MKKDVNRALVAKKMYVTPLSEVLLVSPAAMMMVGTSPTLPSDPGSAPRPRGGKLW